jgi:hypothetical protein
MASKKKAPAKVSTKSQDKKAVGSTGSKAKAVKRK